MHGFNSWYWKAYAYLLESALRVPLQFAFIPLVSHRKTWHPLCQIGVASRQQEEHPLKCKCNRVATQLPSIFRAVGLCLSDSFQMDFSRSGSRGRGQLCFSGRVSYEYRLGVFAPSEVRLTWDKASRRPVCRVCNPFLRNGGLTKDERTSFFQSCNVN